jgi:flagellar biosynthesis/type III secretory pathway protein FliH
MQAFTDFNDRPSGTVLFAEDFDLPPKRNPVPEPEIIEPVFAAADLEAARKQAWQAGHDAASESAEHAMQAVLGDAAAAIVAALADARAQAATLAHLAADELARLLLDSLAAAFPALCARHGEAELRALIRILLPALSQEPAVTIRLNPDNVVAVLQAMQRLDPELADRVQVVASETIARGDTRITWRNGQAVRDAAAVWAQVAEILAPSGLLSYATTKEVEHVE